MTPQYEGLERLHEEYADRGLVVLGFPCDQFGHQEPGDEAEIKEFCSLTYGVDVPDVRQGRGQRRRRPPAFAWLRSQAPADSGEAIEWNFTKFLDRPGRSRGQALRPDDHAGGHRRRHRRLLHPSL